MKCPVESCLTHLGSRLVTLCTRHRWMLGAASPAPRLRGLDAEVEFLEQLERDRP